MRPKLLACTIAAIAIFATAPTPAAVFFAAHPDDVEYMMARNALIDVSSNYPTVFVLLTAGDAGYGASIGPNVAQTPYYRARLSAHESAIRFWQGLNPQVHAPPPVDSYESFGSFSVEKVIMGNVTLYNLNLPDSEPRLYQLYSGAVGQLTDVEGRNTYTLAALKEVLRQIIERNNRNTPNIVINLPDPDDNPEDHVDHLATGLVVRQAVNESPAHQCLYRAYYKGYVIRTLPDAMTAHEKTIHIATIGAMNSGLLDKGNLATWDAFHNSFFGKQSFRSEAGGSAGSCNF